MVPRSLPMTCTAMVTLSATSSVGFGFRPGQFGDQMAILGEQTGVYLLGQVRHHRAAQAGQHFDCLSPGPGETCLGRGALGVGDGVGQFVEASHGDVEGETFQGLGDGGDTAVRGPAQRAACGAESRRASSRSARRRAPRPGGRPAG